MILKKFNKIFGLRDSLEKERVHFVQRINQTIFKTIKSNPYPDNYEHIFRDVCYLKGLNGDDIINSANGWNYSSSLIVPSFRRITEDDFMETLKILVLLYKSLSGQNLERLNSSIELALSYADTDLGVDWKDGMFYPSGARELDKILIEEAYEWLVDYPDERRDFMAAISHYTKKQYGDVISNAYLVVEGLARKILENNKTLNNNREQLIKLLNLSQQWKSLLSNYINYANEFKRHASDKRGQVNPIEVEGFLYLTGLLTRLIIQSKKS